MILIIPSKASGYSPDFAYKEPVEQEAQGEEDHALDEGGEEHPAQAVHG